MAIVYLVVLTNSSCGCRAQGMVYRGEITSTGAVIAAKQINTNEINRNELVSL
jgi:hypothetical protein